MPWEFTVEVGTLPAGSYTVELYINSVLDQTASFTVMMAEVRLYLPLIMRNYWTEVRPCLPLIMRNYSASSR
jgi:hypothetical protein